MQRSPKAMLRLNEKNELFVSALWEDVLAPSEKDISKTHWLHSCSSFLNLLPKFSKSESEVLQFRIERVDLLRCLVVRWQVFGGVCSNGIATFVYF